LRLAQKQFTQPICLFASLIFWQCQKRLPDIERKKESLICLSKKACRTKKVQSGNSGANSKNKNLAALQYIITQPPF